VMGHRNRVAHWSEGVMVREERQDIVDSIIKFIKKFLGKANLHNLKDTASLDSLSDDGIKTEGLNIMKALYEQLNELLCSLSKSTILASNNVKFVIGDGNTTYIAENINIGIPPYPKNEDDVKPLALKFESEDDETPTGRNAGDGGKVQNDCEMNKQDGTVQMDEVFLKMIFRGEKFFKSEKPSQKHVAQLALKKLGIEAKLADSIQTLEDYVLKNGHGKKKPVYCLDNQIPTHQKYELFFTQNATRCQEKLYEGAQLRRFSGNLPFVIVEYMRKSTGWYRIDNTDHTTNGLQTSNYRRDSPHGNPKQNEVLIFEGYKYICNYVKPISTGKQLRLEAMSIETNSEDKSYKTLWNILLNGLSSEERNIYSACLKVDSSQLDSKKVMELAAYIESCTMKGL
ncbi:hypothetical protein CAPTEDRAFT_208060, partial [Capitella teleta]